MDKEPITLNGINKLKEELIYLKEKKRPEIVAAIAEARSHGDLKENAEYHAAKEEQSHNEGRINEINDGPGIDEKEYDNVFKPFYKIDKGRADSKSSVGLGLSIASDIIRSHGGNIKLEKSSMNGLSVKIFLPV